MKGQPFEGWEVQSSPGSDTWIEAYRTPGDPLGYHEVQQMDQCARHTLNMLVPHGALATEPEYQRFVADVHGGRRPTEEGSLELMKQFQDWRIAPGVTDLPVLRFGRGNLDGTAASKQLVKADLQGAMAVGVGYLKPSGGHHNVTLRQGRDGVFRAFDPQSAVPVRLEGADAKEAVESFVKKQGSAAPGLGWEFEYLVEDPSARAAATVLRPGSAASNASTGSPASPSSPTAGPLQP